jgi:hypothetical protein
VVMAGRFNFRDENSIFFCSSMKRMHHCTLDDFFQLVCRVLDDS